MPCTGTVAHVGQWAGVQSPGTEGMILELGLLPVCALAVRTAHPEQGLASFPCQFKFCLRKQTLPTRAQAPHSWGPQAWGPSTETAAGRGPGPSASGPVSPIGPSPIPSFTSGWDGLSSPFSRMHLSVVQPVLPDQPISQHGRPSVSFAQSPLGQGTPWCNFSVVV